jgi:hypothetical protein
MHFHFPHPHIDFAHIVDQVRDAMKHYRNEKDSEAHQVWRPPTMEHHDVS